MECFLVSPGHFFLPSFPRAMVVHGQSITGPQTSLVRRARVVLPEFRPVGLVRFHGGTPRHTYLPTCSVPPSSGRGVNDGKFMGDGAAMLDNMAVLNIDQDKLQEMQAVLKVEEKNLEQVRTVMQANMALKEATRKEQEEVDARLDDGSLSAKATALLERKERRLEERAVDLERVRNDLEGGRDEIVARIAELRARIYQQQLLKPMETLMRQDGTLNELALPRQPSSVLAPKPDYDPATSDSADVIDRTHLIVSSWLYLVRECDQGLLSLKNQTLPTNDDAGGEVATDVSAPSIGGAAGTLEGVHSDGDAAAAVPIASETSSKSIRNFTRAIGVVMASSGCGKTHLAADVWHAGDKLDRQQYVRAARAAGISDVVWNVIAERAKETRICCVNFNGLSSWSAEDEAMVKRSTWYMKAYIKEDQQKPEKHIDDAHKLPLYLRVLWCLLYQATVPYPVFALHAWMRIRNGWLSVDSVIEEALLQLRGGRIAILVDELTMATVFPHDRRLCELYRHIICTFSNAGPVTALFFSLSFLFILAEVSPQQVTALISPGGMPPRARMSTPGGMGDGSPWSLVTVGTLSPPSFDQLYDNLLPVVQARSIYLARSVAGAHMSDSEEVTSAMARICGGHLRTLASLRQAVAFCEPSTPLWDVISSACVDTGMTSSVANLLLQTLCFPALLVAGFISCTVEGSSPLMPAIGARPSDDYCVFWDDAFYNNLLCSSSSMYNKYKNPAHIAAFLLAVSTPWDTIVARMEKEDMEVQPDVANIVASFARLVSAARISDPGRAWEVTTYWSEVLLSRLRHAATLYLVGAPGVSGVVDYSRIALRDLYKGIANLETGPQPHALLSEVLVDSTTPLQADDVEMELIDSHSDMAQVLELPRETLLSHVFMTSDSHASFDMVRFVRVVQDPRPESSSSCLTDGLLALCLSCKSTSNVDVTVPIESKVLQSERLMSKAFGNQWSKWEHNAVHITICNFWRTSKPTVFLDGDAAAKHMIVVCREQFEATFGKCLGELLSSAHVLHSSKVVR